MARVVRPSTDPDLFAYLEPLLVKSQLALDALPADGAVLPLVDPPHPQGSSQPVLTPE